MVTFIQGDILKSSAQVITEVILSSSFEPYLIETGTSQVLHFPLSLTNPTLSVRIGLDHIRRHYANLGIHSLAIPFSIYNSGYLDQIEDLEVYVYV